ncbi:MAG: TonB-dependent receptor [Bacteroidales bacterium]|nr:TonB-dependent receptor [Bacteroidales bacterium]MCF8404336.1 TonB-dependent receptor [Bacteroidales bacterium]
MKSKHLIVACLFLFAGFLHAQNDSWLQGKILDIESNAPIDNVTIIISGTDKGAKTNKSGSFKLEGLKPGNYLLEIRHLSYVKEERTIIIQKGLNTLPVIYLSKKITDLEEIIIEESTQQSIISKLTYIETQFSKLEIERNNANDVGEFLRSSKNINGIRKGGSQIDPVLRGFKLSQLNVMTNGHQKVEGGCPNRMDPASSHIEIEQLENIEIIKGPYALKYGPSFGGVINLNTTRPAFNEKKSIHVTAGKSWESNWNGTKENIAVFGNMGKLYYHLAAGQKDYGNYKDGNDNTVNSEFYKYNYNGTLGYQFNEDQRLIVRHSESKGRNIAFPSLPMDERKDDTQMSSLEYTLSNPKGRLTSLNLQLFNSGVRHEMDNKNRPFSDTVVAVSIIHAYNTGGRLAGQIHSGFGEFTFGADYEAIRKDGQRDKHMILQPGLPVKEEKLWNNAKINNLGIFTEFTSNINKTEIVASIRADFNQAQSDSISIFHPMQGEIFHYAEDSIQSEFTNFSLSAGITQPINNNLSVSFAAGRGVRSPDMTERYIILLPIGYDKFDYLGNPQLKPEVNNQVDLTFKYKTKKFGDFQLNGFYSFLNDYIHGKRLPPSIQKPLSKDVLGVKQFYNAGNAQMRGFEFGWASPVKNPLQASLFASYTYGSLDEATKYILDENGEVIDDEIIKNDALTEIPPFEASLGLKYKLLNGKLIPELMVRAVAAQKHVSDASYEVESEGFIISNFYLSWKFNSTLSLAGGVKNIFDAAYYEHLNRNIIGSSNNLYEPGRSFFLKIKFEI